MRGYGAYVVGLQPQLVGSVERPLVILMASVGFVLLIACANLSNLMLGRATARRKELAIRTALGAGRWRLVRQIVTESLVLAGFGSVAGVLLAYWAMSFFVRAGGSSIPRAESIALDGRVLGFTLVLATLSALLAGLLPALHASRAAIADSLRDGGRQSAGISSRRTRSVLVAAEVALALVLLTGAGLLVRTLWSMQHLDRGFQVERIATARVSPPGTCVPDAGGCARLLCAAARACPCLARRRIGRDDDRRVDAAAGELRHLHDRRQAVAAAGRTDRISGRARVARTFRDAGYSARARANVHRSRSRGRAAGRRHQRDARAARMAERGSGRPSHARGRRAVAGALADGRRRDQRRAPERCEASDQAGAVSVLAAVRASNPDLAGA